MASLHFFLFSMRVVSTQMKVGEEFVTELLVFFCGLGRLRCLTVYLASDCTMFD
jgi:hypothetical protein